MWAPKPQLITIPRERLLGVIADAFIDGDKYRGLMARRDYAIRILAELEGEK